MTESEVKFKREDREGIVAIGSYIIDVAKRFGIHFESPCVQETNTHFCSVAVTKGAESLSGDTKAEKDYFTINDRGTHERLACQVKIERPGEVEIMTKEKVNDQASDAAMEDKSEQYRKEFEEMPLEKKIANLVQLETIAFGETVSFIMNSPFKIADMMMGVMAEFGIKKEVQQKTAARPDEHKSEVGKKSPSKNKKKSNESKAESAVSE